MFCSIPFLSSFYPIIFSVIEFLLLTIYSIPCNIKKEIYSFSISRRRKKRIIFVIIEFVHFIRFIKRKEIIKEIDNNLIDSLSLLLFLSIPYVGHYLRGHHCFLLIVQESFSYYSSLLMRLLEELILVLMVCSNVSD